MSRDYEYVRTTYGVPVYVGKRVKDEKGRKGTIIEPAEGTGAHVTVRLDTERRGAPYHPNSIVYLADDEPPAPYLPPSTADYYTFDGKVVGDDPWQVEAARVILLRTEYEVIFVSGPAWAKEIWGSYDLNNRDWPTLPEKEGFYEATLVETTWAWEGDNEFALVDAAPFPMPLPGWGSKKCGRCGEAAVLPWPYQYDSEQSKRYRCIACDEATFIEAPQALKPALVGGGVDGGAQAV